MSNFPASLDGLDDTHPLGSQTLSQGGHSSLHREIHAILNAMEAKMGIDNSAVTNSMDYQLSGVAPGDKAASLTGTEILTGKTMDGDLNTFQDLALSSLKTVLAQASTFITRDGAGAVISTKAVPSGEVVGTTDQQIQVLPRLDRPQIGDHTYAGHNHTSAREGGILPLSALPTLPYGLLDTVKYRTPQTTISTEVDLTGLALTVIVPPGGRKLKITGWIPQITSTVITDRYDLHLKEGTTDLAVVYGTANTNGVGGVTVMVPDFEAAEGSHTFKLTLARTVGTGTLSTYAGAETAAFVMAEMVGMASVVPSNWMIPTVQPISRRRDRRWVYPSITTGRLT